MNYGDPNAMDNLVGLYWESGNFNKAEKWNEKSMKLGSKIARHMEKPIAEMLLKINSDFHRLTDWEKEHNLPIENLTIKERLLRKISHEHPDKPEILKVLKDLQGIRNRSEKPSPTNLTKGYKYDLEVLAKRKDKSVFSNRMYFAVLRFFQAMDIFTNIEGRSTAVLDSDSRSFIRRLAECYKLEHFVGTMPMDIREKVCEQIVLLLAESDRVVQHCNNDDELAFNQDCRICYAVLNMQSDEIIDFLTECIKKYPNNTFFLEMRGSMYNFKEKRELALRDYIRVDELTKDDVDNTYHKAVTLKLMGRNVQAIETYKKFLSLASVDHRKVPEAYYAIGVCVFAKRRDSDMDPDSIAPYYIQGLEAEKEQIPFLLPYDSTSKELLELMLRMTKKLPVINAEVKEKPVVKPIDPLRKELIVDHRRGVKQFSKLKNSSGYKYNFTATPSETQSVPMSLVGLKPTYLNEIDPTSDRVLHGYVLELTLITAPFDNSMSISFVAEDSNSDVQRVSLYNFDKIHLLAIGAKISIINPYIRMAMDNKPLIRVDDPNSVIVSPHRVVDMCHFCGKSHSKYACSKCKKSKYCSKECQDLDWKEYSHKLICVS
ncbi:hypothetical protein BGW41_007026 [Actinomortierella wolfii]|nr:hypothetical protein BGW41_007026 [Actinomortierella wolfii]